MGHFVKPQVARLHLADVHKREHVELLANKKATKDEIAASEARLAQAVAEGDYIDVKRRLNAGEQQDLFSAVTPYMQAGEKVQLNSKSIMTAKVLAYLLGWSLTDDGKPVPLSADMPEADRLATIRSLDPDTFSVIREAVEAHETAIDKEVAELKARPFGENALLQT